ncbi:MAG TPA: alpha-hydroxy-acid oxidizing protein [Bryobacteraceae bacterium]|nr:alpha-hydroxy-acid oxidizing protein [Bryobacteraceae bacterium]
MSQSSLTRRHALACVGSLLAGSPLLQGQQAAGELPGRIPAAEELVNVFEVESMAQRKLDSLTYSEIAGSDRKAFDRVTLRPRVMVNTMKLDLTTDLFGQRMFSPILVGPIEAQKRFHADGELAMARGAGAAKVAMVVSSRSSNSLEQIAGASDTLLWYQVFPGPVETVRGQIEQAVKSGCKAVCLTLGTPQTAMDWTAIGRLRSGINIPFLLKGILSPEDAAEAVTRGVQGIIVSNYRGPFTHGMAAPIEMLPSIVDAVAGKAPVLIDGSFRRGTDILKALALGARAVLLGRPPLWGLAAYGASGVQYVLTLLQNELARAMVMCGKANLQLLDRATVKIHRW